MADKLGIPVAYLRRTRAENVDLYDANLNGWLAQQPTRRPLLRTLRGADGSGVARAVLSERYRFVDNQDDAGTAYEMERVGVRAMTFAAARQR